MKNLFKFTAIAALFLLASCTKEAIVNEVTADDAIRFGTFMEQATKAEIFDNEAMQSTGFGVMGYRTAQIGWNAAAATATPDFMYNEHITYNDIVANGWGYNPVKYWSNIEGDKYTFFAYAPYSSSVSDIEISENDAAGAPVVSFTVNNDPKAMVDFVAGQEINVQQQTDAVKFNLKHQLTRITFSATTDIDADEAKGTNETYVVIKRMDLVTASKFYQSGDYTFDNEDTTGYEDYDTPEETEADHDQDGVWSNLVAFTSAYPFSTLLDVNEESIGGYTESGVRVQNDNTIYTPLFIEDQYLFLLPPNGQNGIKSDGEISFEIEYQIVTADSSLSAGYTASDPKISTVSFPEESLKQGRAYNLILTIDLTEVKVQAVVIDWDEEYDVNAESGYGENPATEDEEESYVEEIILTLNEDRANSPAIRAVNDNTATCITGSHELRIFVNIEYSPAPTFDIGELDAPTLSWTWVDEPAASEDGEMQNFVNIPQLLNGSYYEVYISGGEFPIVESSGYLTVSAPYGKDGAIISSTYNVIFE